MDIAYRKLESIADYEACEDLQKEIWGFPEREIVPANELITAQRYGGFIAGAFDPRRRMIGFVFGFAGIKNGKPIHCSRMLGVLPEYRNENVGFRLKLMQREFALSLGLDLVVWTIDPLVGKNAFFNIEKLGVVARAYEVNVYGVSMSRFLHGLETDRFVAEWEIRSQRVAKRTAGESDTPKLREALADYPLVARVERLTGGVLRMGEPDLSVSGRRVLVEIPENVQPIEEKEASLAKDWREKTRRVFLHYFGVGYTVTGLVTGFERDVRRNLYVLERGYGKGETKKLAFAETGYGV